MSAVRVFKTCLNFLQLPPADSDAACAEPPDVPPLVSPGSECAEAQQEKHLQHRDEEMSPATSAAIDLGSESRQPEGQSSSRSLPRMVDALFIDANDTHAEGPKRKRKPTDFYTPTTGATGSSSGKAASRRVVRPCLQRSSATWSLVEARSSCLPPAWVTGLLRPTLFLRLIRRPQLPHRLPARRVRVPAAGPKTRQRGSRLQFKLS